MSYRENKYFHNLSLVSYVESHHKIYENMQKIENPIISGSVETYGKILKQLETMVKIPVPGYISSWNEERARAYKICQAAVKSLADFNSNKDRETVQALSKAFSHYIAGATSTKVTAAIEHALALVESIPADQLEKLAIKDRIDYLAKVQGYYLTNSGAAQINRDAAKDEEVKTYRRCCDIASRSSINIAEKLNHLGDESCREFIHWMNSKNYI